MKNVQQPNDVPGPSPDPSTCAFYSTFRGPGVSPPELLYHVLREHVVVGRGLASKQRALEQLVALYNRLAVLLPPREECAEDSSWAVSTHATTICRTAGC